MNKHITNIIKSELEEVNLNKFTWSESFWWMFGYERNISSFLHITKIINIGKTYTCKSCKNRIYDKEFLYTHESYSPFYHIKCYMELFDIIKPLILRGLDETVNDVVGKVKEYD